MVTVEIGIGVHQGRPFCGVVGDAERLEFRGDVGEGLRRQAGHRIGIRIGIGQGEFGQATERLPGGFAAGDHADEAIARVAG